MDAKGLRARTPFAMMAAARVAALMQATVVSIQQRCWGLHLRTASTWERLRWT